MSCRKEKTSWDTEWVGPLVSDSLSVLDYVNDSTLALNSDNSVDIALDRMIGSINLSNFIQIPDTSIFQSFTLNVNSLELLPGTNFVDEVKEHEFDLEDVVLREARLKSGRAKITVFNPINTGVFFKVQLPGVEKNGFPLTREELVPSAQNGTKGTKTFEIDLSKHMADMTGASGDLANRLQSRMSVRTDPQGESVVMTNQDTVYFKIELNDMKADYAMGYFGKRDISDSVDVDVEELAKIVDGSVNFNTVDFDLKLYNGIKTMGQLKIPFFKSINANGNELALNHPDFGELLNIDAAQGYWSSHTPAERTISFTNGNSNIESFLENLGSQYRLGYHIKINPWGNISNGTDRIYPSSRLVLNLRTKFPMDLALNDLVYVDTFDFSVNNKRELIELKSGSFTLEYKSTFPFGGQLNLVLLGENGKKLGVISANEVVQSAPMGTDGQSHKDIQGEVNFPFEETISAKLDETEKIIFKFKVFSENDGINQVYANARFAFLLKTNFKLNSEL